MRRRCYRVTYIGYQDYGGRGIRVCERWDSFENFLADMGFRPSPQHSLDRIDVNGNYEPGNCRWATDFEQANNKRDNRRIEFRGETRTLKEWANTLGVSHTTLADRIDRHGVEWALAQERKPCRSHWDGVWTAVVLAACWDDWQTSPGLVGSLSAPKHAIGAALRRLHRAGFLKRRGTVRYYEYRRREEFALNGHGLSAADSAVLIKKARELVSAKDPK